MSTVATNRSRDATRLLSDLRLWLGLAALALMAAVAWALVAKVTLANRAVLIVDGRETSIDYFVKRVAMSDLEPLVVLKNLAYEDIMRQEAPKPPFDIQLTEEDVEDFIRSIAAEPSGKISDAEFDLWIRQQLNETGLNEQEYRGYMQTQLLYERMTEELVRRQPMVAPQVRLSSIAGMTAQTAESVVRRLAAGERFADLAEELNTLPKLKDSGGDIGWYTRDELEIVFAAQVFDVLDVGEVGMPFQMPDGTFNIVQVTERDPAREIGAVALNTIRSGLLERWLAGLLPRYSVQFRGLTGGYDSATDAWVRGKAEAMKQNAPSPS